MYIQKHMQYILWLAGVLYWNGQSAFELRCSVMTGTVSSMLKCLVESHLKYVAFVEIDKVPF